MRSRIRELKRSSEGIETKKRSISLHKLSLPHSLVFHSLKEENWRNQRERTDIWRQGQRLRSGSGLIFDEFLRSEWMNSVKFYSRKIPSTRVPFFSIRRESCHSGRYVFLNEILGGLLVLARVSRYGICEKLRRQRERKRERERTSMVVLYCLVHWFQSTSNSGLN